MANTMDILPTKKRPIVKVRYENKKELLERLDKMINFDVGQEVILIPEKTIDIITQILIVPSMDVLSTDNAIEYRLDKKSQPIKQCHLIPVDEKSRTIIEAFKNLRF